MIDTTRTRPAANLSTSLSGSGNSGFTLIKVVATASTLRKTCSDSCLTVVTLPPAPTSRITTRNGFDAERVSVASQRTAAVHSR